MRKNDYMKMKEKHSSVYFGHWKATGHFFRKIIWKILYRNLDLTGGWYRGARPPWE